MEINFHGLPPHKRFSLAQKHQQNQNQNTFPVQNNRADLSLPAKKRKQSMEEEDLPPFPPNSSTPFCLPAKKRIRAFQPFDLNLECVPTVNPIEQIGEGIVEEEEDGIVCAVCGSTDGDPMDPIVLCDGCDLMVHTSCYGNPFTSNGIPEGDWFCAKCLVLKSGLNVQISCCLCPNSGGALKATTCGRWAHLECAIYVPEVYFEDPKGREGIDCGKVLKRRWNGKCYICGMRNYGCVIDCSEPRCGMGFHVSCGVKEELCIEYREGRNKGSGGVVAAFCRAHTDLWKKQQQTGKFKIVARDEDKNLLL